MTKTGESRVDHPEKMARTAMEASGLYGFLAAIFRKEISPELLDQIRDSEFRTALQDLSPDLGWEFLDGSREQILGELAVEYTSLFLGPGGHISPHESVYSDNDSTLWGEETVAVKSYIEATGLEYKDSYTGLPDHISVELEYMGEIARHEVEAWESGDREKVENSLAFADEFMSKHIATWVPKFCTKVADSASLPFYRELAKLTGEFVESERQDIKARIEAAKRIFGEQPQRAAV